MLPLAERISRIQSIKTLSQEAAPVTAVRRNSNHDPLPASSHHLRTSLSSPPFTYYTTSPLAPQAPKKADPSRLVRPATVLPDLLASSFPPHPSQPPTPHDIHSRPRTTKPAVPAGANQPWHTIMTDCYSCRSSINISTAAPEKRPARENAVWYGRISIAVCRCPCPTRAFVPTHCPCRTI